MRAEELVRRLASAAKAVGGWLVRNSIPQALVAFVIARWMGSLAANEGWSLHRRVPWAAAFGAVMGFYTACFAGTRRALLVGVVGGAAGSALFAWGAVTLMPGSGPWSPGRPTAGVLILTTSWLFPVAFVTGFYRAGRGSVRSGALRGLVAWGLNYGLLMLVLWEPLSALWQPSFTAAGMRNPSPVLKWAVISVIYVAGALEFLPVFWRSRLLAPPPGWRIMALRRGKFSLRSVLILTLLVTSAGWLRYGKVPNEPAARLADGPLKASEAQISPDGRLMITAGTDGVRVWDLDKPGEFRRLGEEGEPAGSACFGPGRGRACSSDDLGDVRVWEVQTGRLLHTINTGEPYVDLVVPSPDGRRIVVGLPDFRAAVYDTARWKRLAVLKDVFGGGGGSAFSPDGELFAARTPGPRPVRVWETEGWTVVAEVKPGGDSGHSVVFSPDGKRLLSSASVGKKMMTVISDPRTGKRLATVDGYPPFLSDHHAKSVFSPDGKRFLTVTTFAEVNVWELETSRRLRIIGRGSTGILQAGYMPGGGRILGGLYDFTVWDERTGRRLARVPEANLRVLPVDADTIVSYSYLVPAIWRLSEIACPFGILARREFWATLLFAGLLGWSLWKDTRTFGPAPWRPTVAKAGESLGVEDEAR